MLKLVGSQATAWLFDRSGLAKVHQNYCQREVVFFKIGIRNNRRKSRLFKSNPFAGGLSRSAATAVGFSHSVVAVEVMRRCCLIQTWTSLRAAATAALDK